MVNGLLEKGTQGLRGLGVDGVARLEGRDAGVQEAARETEIAQQVQQFVPAAFIREMKAEIAQIAVCDVQVRQVQELRDGGELPVIHGPLDDHDGVVHVAPLDEIVPEQGLDLVEEAEGPAYADLPRIVHGFVPTGLLDAQDPGIEIRRHFGGRGVGRFDAYPGAALFIPDLQRVRDVDVFARNALVLETVLEEGIDVRFRAAVQDGHFLVVQFDEGIVHAQAREGGHDMFDGDRLRFSAGYGGAAGGACDVFCEGIHDRRRRKVGTAEPDSVSGGGRHHFHMGIRPRMEAFPFEEVAIPERMLVLSHGAKVRKKAVSHKGLLGSALAELGVGAHILLRVDARRAQQGLPFLPDVADDAGLGQQGRMVRDGQMAGDAHLPRDDAVLADGRGPGDAHLGRHHGMVADHHVVRDLAQVVDADAVPDDGGFHLGAVHGGVAADFHVVADDDVSEMFDLFPAAVRLRRVAEAVAPDDAARMQDHPVADDHAGIDDDTGINDAILADRAVVTDGHMVVDDGIVSDLRPFAHGAEIAQPHLLPELGGAVPAGAEAATAPCFLFLAGDILQQLGDGRIGVVHAHQGGLHGLFGLERLVHQQDGGLAGIDELFVFRVGEESQGPGFSVFDLGELRDGGVLVALHGPVEHLGQLFGSEFHNKLSLSSAKVANLLNKG